ncbi:MAG: cobalt-zinc-cadmium efflux system outer membrane protein [Limisphaerales bacterium]
MNGLFATQKKKVMVRLKILSLLLLLPCLTSAQTLEDYIKLALEENPSVDAKESDWKAATNQIDIVSTLPDPVVGVGVFILPIETRVGPQILKSSISQSVPWFGTLGQKKRSQEFRAEAFHEDWLAEQRKLIYQVSTLWGELYRIDQHIKIIEENLTILNSINELAQTRYEAGKSTLVDVIRARLKVQETETQLVNQDLDYNAKQAEFNTVLDRKLDEIVDVSDSIYVPNIDSLIRAGLEVHPALLVWQNRANAFTSDSEVAQKEGMPSFGFGLEYAWVGRREDVEILQNGQDIVAPTMSISIPLSRRKYNAKIEQAQLLQLSAEQQYEALYANFSMQINNASLKLDKERNLRKLYLLQIEETRSAQNILISSYTSGLERFEDVLNMQQQTIKLEMLLIDSEVNKYLASIEIQYFTGQNLNYE